jgi:hypothetical protein
LENQPKQPRKGLLQLRIAPEIRERIDAMGKDTGRTPQAAATYLIEQGLILHSMTEGRSKGLMLDLFVGARMAADLTGPAAPLAILDAIRKHYAPGDTLTAIDAFRDRLLK